MNLPGIPANLHESVLRTLYYFDIFSYPLTLSEVHDYTAMKASDEAIERTLSGLISDSIVFNLNGYYSIRNEVALAERRAKGNAMAEATMPIARRRSKLIQRFPFVRAVMISGSMSKGYMDADSDLDFFIVTEPGRLWIARTALVLFKRIFLGNSHKHFCVNYFIDSDHLAIEEQNLFTATELATLLPMTYANAYQALIQENDWVKKFFPNYSQRSTADVADGRPSWPKKITESIVNLSIGRWLDDACRRLTLARWQKIYGKDYSPEEFELAFRTTAHVSKNHPRSYQRKVLQRYDDKLNAHQKKQLLVSQV